MIKFSFGSQQTAFKPQSLWCLQDSATLLHKLSIADSNLQGAQHLIMLKQTHSSHGIALRSTDAIIQNQPFTHEGDYLITDQRRVALGVATADCLPLILIDTKKPAIAVVHAGWKGTQQLIAVQALEHMQRECSTDPKQIRVIFGPYAKPCCYKVQADFISHFYDYPEAFAKRHEKIFFDNLYVNKEQLKKAGVPEDHCINSFAVCTICNVEYCSVRRDKEQALRQLSWAMLL